MKHRGNNCLASLAILGMGELSYNIEATEPYTYTSARACYIHLPICISSPGSYLFDASSLLNVSDSHRIIALIRKQMSSTTGVEFYSKATDPRSHEDASSDSTQTQSTNGKDTDSSCTKSTDDNCSKDREACYWPLFIFIIIFIIIIIVCFCGGYGSSWNNGCGSGGMGLIGGAILFFIIWIIALWFFCRSGNMVAAWFFLVLIFALLFTWWIASILAGLSCC